MPLLLLLLACSSTPQNADFTPLGPALAAPVPEVAWSLDSSELPELGPKKAAELGRIAVAMEAQLYRGVIPTGPDGRPPAVATAPATAQHQLTLVPHSDGRMEASWCDPDGACELIFLRGEPEAIGTDLAERVLARVGVPQAVLGCLADPPSRDPYASLVTGRSAAVRYGWLPLDGTPGDRRTDPVARAVHLDPASPTGQWLAGRAAWSRGETDAAALHLRRAAERCPGLQGWAADDALIAALSGHRRGAFPADDRFLFARLDAGLALGATETYDEAVEAAARWPTDARVEQRAADAAPDTTVEDHLARWAQLDDADPEPVRRLAVRAIADRDWSNLLAHGEELQRRGVDTRAWRTQAWLALGEVERALEVAPPELYDRVGARLGAEPRGDSPEERLLKARRALATDPAAALAACEAVLAVRPHWPEALRLAADAAAAAGRNADAYRVRLRQAEPSGGLR